MAPRFDHSRHHAIISGMPGVKFAQDGHYFNAGGHAVPNPEEETPPEPEVQPAALPEPSTMTEETITQSVEPAKVKSDDMRLSANKALKLQMENYGEPWQGVDHARKFLGIE